MALRSQTPWLGPNNAPNWGPARPLVVSDPGKLSMFARANMVRAAVRGSYGALGGIGNIVGNRIVPIDATVNSELGRDWAFDPETMYGDATASGSGSSGNVASPNGTSTVDQFFNRLNSLLSPQPTVQAVPAPPSPLPMLLIGAAALGAGYLLAKKFKVI